MENGRRGIQLLLYVNVIFVLWLSCNAVHLELNGLDLSHAMLAMTKERRVSNGRSALLFGLLDSDRRLIFIRTWSFCSGSATWFGSFLSLDRIDPPVLVVDATAL